MWGRRVKDKKYSQYNLSCRKTFQITWANFDRSVWFYSSGQLTCTSALLSNTYIYIYIPSIHGPASVFWSSSVHWPLPVNSLPFICVTQTKASSRTATFQWQCVSIAMTTVKEVAKAPLSWTASSFLIITALVSFLYYIMYNVVLVSVRVFLRLLVLVLLQLHSRHTFMVFFFTFSSAV